MRGKGEGSVYQRADGYWVGQIEAGHYRTGQRRRARVVRKRKVDVLDALDELRRARRDGLVPDRTSTVETFLAFWLDEVAAGHVAESSLAEYRKRVRRLTPNIGKVKLHKLSAGHVQRAVNHLTDTYSPKTARTTLETLRSALRWAVQAGMVARNAAEGARVRSTPLAKVDDTLTAAEAQAVVRAAEGTDLHALVYLAVVYGLRQGEILDLRWSDVDLPGKEVTVRKSKTAAGVRTLPLIPEAARVLKGHRARTPMRGPDALVFPRADGGRRSPQRIRDAWSGLLAKAGVKHLCTACGTDKKCSTSTRRFHSSRHSAASLLLEQGVELEVVSAILGHSSIVVTSSIYARVRADAVRKGLTRIGT